MSESKRFDWSVALILLGVLFLGVSDTQLIPPLLPLIAKDMNMPAGRAGIIVTCYSLAAAMFALFAGPVSDRIGRKKVLSFGLALFSVASFLTYHVSTYGALLILRTLTGLSAGVLSTCSLSLAGDHFPYAQRGRAMGVISMAYFCAFVIGVPLAAFVASRQGWHVVFGILAAMGGLMLALTAMRLPADATRATKSAVPFSYRGLLSHFHRPERMAGVVAAFLTSGGIVGFLTYVGAWLQSERGIGIDRIGLLFMVSGLAAMAASPLSGWLSDHAGKKSVIIWANVALAVLFMVVARIESGIWLVLGIATLSIAASARQAPLHAVTTELVGPEIRGEYIAVRNAASQLGIATMATVSAYAFDSGGFAFVSIAAAAVTVLIPITCLWIPEPRQ